MSVYIIGAGGHGRVIAAALDACGIRPAGFIEADKAKFGTIIDGIPVLAEEEVIGEGKPLSLVNGVGSTSSVAVRHEVFERFAAHGHRFMTVVHPSATVAKTAAIGEGTLVMAGAIVQPGARIGVNVIINTGAIVDHDCHIGDHCHIAPGSVLSGGVRVGTRSHVGTGATIIEGIQIGSGVLVGAGSMIIRDIGDNKRVAGVPAKEMTT